MKIVFKIIIGLLQFAFGLYHLINKVSIDLSGTKLSYWFIGFVFLIMSAISFYETYKLLKTKKSS